MKCQDKEDSHPIVEATSTCPNHEWPGPTGPLFEPDDVYLSLQTHDMPMIPFKPFHTPFIQASSLVKDSPPIFPPKSPVPSQQRSCSSLKVALTLEVSRLDSS
ncbi:hypothetical protein Droror1_Dr00010338 [Drosera rotundifolia]